MLFYERMKWLSVFAQFFGSYHKKSILKHYNPGSGISMAERMLPAHEASGSIPDTSIFNLLKWMSMNYYDRIMNFWQRPCEYGWERELSPLFVDLTTYSHCSSYGRPLTDCIWGDLSRESHFLTLLWSKRQIWSVLSQSSSLLQHCVLSLCYLYLTALDQTLNLLHRSDINLSEYCLCCSSPSKFWFVSQMIR